jgi:hypothetical protein
MDHDRVKGSLRGEAEVNPVHKFSAPLKPATANDLMRGLIQYSGKHGARAGLDSSAFLTRRKRTFGLFHQECMNQECS